MLSRSSIGVLGVIVAGLALVALASIEPGRGRRPPAPVPPPSRPPATAAAVAALRDGAALDLNRAEAPDFELLPGIGPSLARRIVEDRARNGPFATTEELGRVRGIGPRTLARLRVLLRVADGPETGATAGEPSQLMDRASTPSKASRPRTEDGSAAR